MTRRFQFDSSGRPRMLLAYADAAYASECGRYFRRLGWEVEMVANGHEARQIAQGFRPEVVVLEATLVEDGELDLNSLGSDASATRTIMVVDDFSAERGCPNADQTVLRRDGAEALAIAVLGRAYLSQAV